MKTLIGAAEPEPQPESFRCWFTNTTGTATWPPPDIIGFGQASITKVSPPTFGTATTAVTWVQLDINSGR